MRGIAIAGGEAQLVGILHDPGVGIGIVLQADVIEGVVPGTRQRGVHRRAQSRVQPAPDRARAGVIAAPAGEGVGDVILVIDAVGDVQVEVQRGIDAADQRQHRAHFGRVRLPVIAVEVQVLRRRAPPHRARAALVRTVPRAGAFVAVGVEDRHEHQIGMVEQPVLAAQRDVAQQHQPGILAVDLARVDARLDQQHRLARAPLAGADVIERAALCAGAEAFDRQQRRGGDQPVEPRARRVVAGRIVEMRAFRRGDPRIVVAHDQLLAGAVPWQQRRQRGGDRGRRGGGGGEQPEREHRHQ